MLPCEFMAKARTFRPTSQLLMAELHVMGDELLSRKRQPPHVRPSLVIDR